MNRYWTIKPQTELAGNEQVIVRHYYKIYDVDDLKTGFGNLVYFKINSLSNSYTIDPQTDIHQKIRGATSYNKDGIWLFENNGQTSLTSTGGQGGNLALVYFYSQLFPRLYNGYPYGFLSQRFPELDDFVYYSRDFRVGRLNGGGGIGGQTYGGNPRGMNMVLKAGSDWYYYTKAIEPPDIAGYNWKGGQDGLNSDHVYVSYDNFARWNRGPAPLGYSDSELSGPGKDGEVTLIPACESKLDCYEARGTYSNIKPGCAPCDSKWKTTYYRSNFNVFKLSYYNSIIINYKRDDGIIVYFNGAEITHRDENMPSKADVPITTYNTMAIGASNEQEWITKIIPITGNNIREGTNNVAVELHQNSATSSDAHFDMEIVLSPDVAPSTGRIAALEAPLTTEPITILYPNPIETGRVYFNEAVSYETFRIVDARGVVLRYVAEPGTMQELDVSGLASGTYIPVSFKTPPGISGLSKNNGQ
jgi:hypothetical protein